MPLIVVLMAVNIVGVKESAGVNVLLAVVDFMTQLLLVLVGAVLVLSPEILAENVHLGVAPTWKDFVLAIPIGTIAWKPRDPTPPGLDSRAMEALADQRVADLLDAVAAPTPAPGGGSSTAIACALAAALVEMAAGIGAAGGADAARALRARALDLAERELTSYAPVLEARRLPADVPARDERIAAALEEASAVPREIAAVAAEIISLAQGAGAGVSAAVQADAETGRLLAEAAGRAATLLVETNRRDA